MRRIGFALVVVAAALAGTISAASAQAPRLTMIGLGAGVSCSEWVANVGGDEALEQWAFGFASAIAAGAQLEHGTDPLAKMTAESLHAWLRDYCHQHPTSPLSVALIRLVFSGSR
ncbi:hypothetical protein GCM10011504_47490 [Siccirubricoccus deserti]|uniref:Rap1a immunity protein domain-containing protein n=1 Tax=Siccirubricoccus deserti TaxID=2013562 RepID=A0A9X0R4G4_9PROT|nr:hypothetical protein [Siccirubricoccus deserti]MBC4018182.1 hypothetical protein [Siccirubricoccus deserti]GGC63783.1 hypothetical protein GCM10011504_47490 [Siccirubricoccus deserti]